ncbi:MAG: Dyp-type peroxidase [Allosphingosinicella sp.]
MTVDSNDLQGMVLGNIAGYRLVRHLIFSAPDAETLRRFVNEIRPLIPFGTNKPTTAHGWVANISFAAGAMAQLLPSEIYAKLESTFRSPPDAERIGDVGASAPSRWWEGRFRGEEVSCFVHVHAVGDKQLEAGTAEILEEAAAAGLTEKIPRASGGRLDGAFLGFGPAGKGARIHFGYVDGLSSSKIAWAEAPSPERPVDFRSVVIGHYDDRFPCAPARDPAATVLRDSSYLVFRWIYQDVATFERFLTAKGPPLFPKLPPAEARELLAAKIMGRWRDGTPLCVSPDAPAPDRCEEGFVYAEDLQGLACPVSSHVRVMNPRDQTLSGMAVTTGVPQIVRRGMPYGPELKGEKDDGLDRGILGIFVCASIREQFMRLAAWGQRNNFSDSFPAHGRDQDALIGNRAVSGATREFRIPKGPAGGGTVTGLPDFIRTKATQYLLMPSGQTLSRLVPLG